MADMMKRGVLAALLVAAGGDAMAQTRIAAGGWEGFPVRKPDGAFDHCVLYNRTVEALNRSPFHMLGLLRDRQGGVGMSVFFRGGALTRSRQVSATLKIDQSPPVAAAASVVSDFHLRIPGPLAADVVDRLRGGKTLEVAAQGQTLRFETGGLAGALDALAACVTAHARR
jgi:hypothetical protein